MLPVIETGTAALIAGLAISPHCGAMCAPLSCALGPWRGSPEDRMAHAAGYHATRAISYTAAGALAAWLGASFTRTLDTSWVHWAPWALVIWLAALAMGLDRGIRFPSWVREHQAAATRTVQNLGPLSGGMLLGSLSPLLPCGPLHALLGICLLTSKPATGAELGLGFALGTIPLLWASQVGYHRLTLKLGSLGATRIRRLLCGLAALILATQLIWFSPDSGVCL